MRGGIELESRKRHRSEGSSGIDSLGLPTIKHTRFCQEASLGFAGEDTPLHTAPFIPPPLVPNTGRLVCSTTTSGCSSTLECSRGATSPSVPRHDAVIAPDFSSEPVLETTSTGNGTAGSRNSNQGPNSSSASTTNLRGELGEQSSRGTVNCNTSPPRSVRFLSKVIVAQYERLNNLNQAMTQLSQENQRLKGALVSTEQALKQSRELNQRLQYYLAASNRVDGIFNPADFGGGGGGFSREDNEFQGSRYVPDVF